MSSLILSFVNLVLRWVHKTYILSLCTWRHGTNDALNEAYIVIASGLTWNINKLCCICLFKVCSLCSLGFSEHHLWFCPSTLLVQIYTWSRSLCFTDSIWLWHWLRQHFPWFNNKIMQGCCAVNYLDASHEILSQMLSATHLSWF